MWSLLGAWSAELGLQSCFYLDSPTINPFSIRCESSRTFPYNEDLLLTWTAPQTLPCITMLFRDWLQSPCVPLK